MSKSIGNKYSNIYLTTPPSEIRVNIGRALTDSIDKIYSHESRPGITNLLTILSAMENRPINELEREVCDYSPKKFKQRVADSLIMGLSEVQRRYDEVKGDSAWLNRVRESGNKRAQKIARERMAEIREVVGFPPQTQFDRV
jgi:tryptophanyl-tRNA synthetase